MALGQVYVTQAVSVMKAIQRLRVAGSLRWYFGAGSRLTLS